MVIETPHEVLFVDFVIADVVNVREAIKQGATRVENEPAARLLARLEADARSSTPTA
jgi:hypothetical protein